MSLENHDWLFDDKDRREWNFQFWLLHNNLNVERYFQNFPRFCFLEWKLNSENFQDFVDTFSFKCIMRSQRAWSSASPTQEAMPERVKHEQTQADHFGPINLVFHYSCIRPIIRKTISTRDKSSNKLASSNALLLGKMLWALFIARGANICSPNRKYS